MIRMLNIYMSKYLGIRGYFSKPKRTEGTKFWKKTDLDCTKNPSTFPYLEPYETNPHLHKLNSRYPVSDYSMEYITLSKFSLPFVFLMQNYIGLRWLQYMPYILP
jgi:hypothetical protein